MSNTLYTLHQQQHRTHPELLAFSFPIQNPIPQSISFATGPRRRRPAFSLRSSLNEAVTASRTELSFYELLGVPETGSFLEFKRAYKQLARKYHPDVSPPGRVEEFTERFIRVQEAYEVLSDPRRKELYDRNLAKGIFSAGRRRHDFDEEHEDKSEWKIRWQSQLSELKRRSTVKESSDDMSWGARMRRERYE